MDNPLQQYIDLYREHRALIDSHAPEALNALRPEALRALEGATLPGKGCEGYEQTSLADMFAPDYGLNLGRVPVEGNVAASFRCDVPNMSTLLGVTVNDTFTSTAALAPRLPEGVTFASIAEVASTHPELIRGRYGSIAALTDPEVALNTLLMQDGVAVIVRRGVHLEKPLQLVNIFCSATPVMAVRRLLVVMEPDSEARLLVCDHTQPGAAPALSSQVIEVILEENSRLDYCDVEESAPDTSRCSRMFVSQQSGSELRLHGITLSCGVTRNDFDINLLGPDAVTELYGMAIGSDRRHADNRSTVIHTAPRCRSCQTLRYVLDDHSTGAFEGGIVVRQGADATEAYQSCRSVLASEGARMHSSPRLEIYCDDVKCSHGATTGRLDEEALFYMRTRGIPEHEARVMLMQAFMTDVVDSVRIHGLADRLRHLVERRFAGADAACAECNTTCTK